jgi:hypothetical protein
MAFLSARLVAAHTHTMLSSDQRWRREEAVGEEGEEKE